MKHFLSLLFVLFIFSITSCDEDIIPTAIFTINEQVLTNNSDTFTGDIVGGFISEGGQSTKSFTWQNDLTTAFYGVLLTEKLVKVTAMAVEQVEAHVKIAQDLFDAGAATNFDVLRAKVQLANIKS